MDTPKLEPNRGAKQFESFLRGLDTVEVGKEWALFQNAIRQYLCIPQKIRNILKQTKELKWGNHWTNCTKTTVL